MSELLLHESGELYFGGPEELPPSAERPLGVIPINKAEHHRVCPSDRIHFDANEFDALFDSVMTGTEGEADLMMGQCRIRLTQHQEHGNDVRSVIIPTKQRAEELMNRAQRRYMALSMITTPDGGRFGERHRFSEVSVNGIEKRIVNLQSVTPLDHHDFMLLRHVTYRLRDEVAQAE